MYQLNIHVLKFVLKVAIIFDVVFDLWNLIYLHKEFFQKDIVKTH